MISLNSKFAFTHVNKAGGTSIIEALSSWEDATDLSFIHAHAWRVKAYLGEALWDEFKTFGFMRHPLDRLVSSYEYRRQILPPNANSIPAKESDFSTWVKNYLVNCPHDREWGAQVRMLSEKQTTNIIVDRVYFFEDLQEVFPSICSWLEIPMVELPHFNKTEKPHWTTYYDETTEEIAMTRFEEDFVYQREYGKTPWKTWEEAKITQTSNTEEL